MGVSYSDSFRGSLRKFSTPTVCKVFFSINAFFFLLRTTWCEQLWSKSSGFTLSVHTTCKTGSSSSTSCFAELRLVDVCDEVAGKVSFGWLGQISSAVFIFPLWRSVSSESLLGLPALVPTSTVRLKLPFLNDISEDSLSLNPGTVISWQVLTSPSWPSELIKILWLTISAMTLAHPAFSVRVCVCVCVIPQETGFWFIFHHVPTGPSEGLYSPGRTEHTPMGQFINNRAHSNYRVSLEQEERGWATMPLITVFFKYRPLFLIQLYIWFPVKMNALCCK